MHFFGNQLTTQIAAWENKHDDYYWKVGNFWESVVISTAMRSKLYFVRLKFSIGPWWHPCTNAAPCCFILSVFFLSCTGSIHIKHLFSNGNTERTQEVEISFLFVTFRTRWADKRDRSGPNLFIVIDEVFIMRKFNYCKGTLVLDCT